MRTWVLAFTMGLALSSTAKADIFGGDDVILSQILIQTVQQLMELRQIFQTGSDQFQLMQDINRGLNDSLQLMRTVNESSDPGIFGSWRKGSDAAMAVASLYGDVVPSSRDARIQSTTDQSVAEAVTFNNELYDYTRQIDDIGEEVKSDSHSVSPGGAQKLTAESMGVMLHVMNANLRAQATGLKLQAETLALQNHKDKDASRESEEATQAMTEAIQSQTPAFQTPRF